MRTSLKLANASACRLSLKPNTESWEHQKRNFGTVRMIATASTGAAPPSSLQPASLVWGGGAAAHQEKPFDTGRLNNLKSPTRPHPIFFFASLSPPHRNLANHQKSGLSPQPSPSFISFIPFANLALPSSRTPTCQLHKSCSCLCPASKMAEPIRNKRPDLTAP